VVSALTWLGEQGWVEFQASDARQRFTRLVPEADPERLADALVERFERREAQEVARVGQIVELITADGCQTNFLLRYFGEEREEPFGHCTHCERGEPTRLPPLPAPPPIDSVLDAGEVAPVARSH